MVNRFGDLSPAREARAGPSHWLALGLLGLAFLLVMLDGTIVYVALPSIQRELGLSTGALQWVMTPFLLAFGGLLLLGGRVAEVFGRRRAFTAGLALFAAASLLGGLAWSGGALIAARAAQGVGAALVAPTALPLLATVFDEGRARSRALGVWTAIGALGGTAGLVIGGPLVDGPGWRWIFLGSAALAFALAALALALLPDARGDRVRRPLDLAGAATFTGAVAAAVAAISLGITGGWGRVDAVGALAASVILFAAFALVEWRAPQPLVPPHLLGSRTRLGGIAVLVAAGMAVDGVLFVLALFGQRVLGLSATGFGVTMTVLTLSSVVGSFAGQAAVVRGGLRPVAVAGLALAGVGLLLLAAPGDGLSRAGIRIGLLVFGTGLGAAFVSAQIAVTLGATNAQTATVSGLADASFSIGSAIGLALVSAALTRGGPPPGGVHLALTAAVGFVGLGLLAALLLLARPGDDARHASSGSETAA